MTPATGHSKLISAWDCWHGRQYPDVTVCSWMTCGAAQRLGKHTWVASTQHAKSPTTDAQQPEEADEDANVGVHQAKGDHGNALSDDEVDEKVAAVGYGSPNEGRNLPCREMKWQSKGDAGGLHNL